MPAVENFPEKLASGKASSSGGATQTLLIPNIGGLSTEVYQNVFFCAMGLMCTHLWGNNTV